LFFFSRGTVCSRGAKGRIFFYFFFFFLEGGIPRQPPPRGRVFHFCFGVFSDYPFAPRGGGGPAPHRGSGGGGKSDGGGAGGNKKPGIFLLGPPQEFVGIPLKPPGATGGKGKGGGKGGRGGGTGSGAPRGGDWAGTRGFQGGGGRFPPAFLPKGRPGKGGKKKNTNGGGLFKTHPKLFFFRGPKPAGLFGKSPRGVGGLPPPPPLLAPGGSAPFGGAFFRPRRAQGGVAPF